MNRRPPVFKLTKATTGFLQYKTAEGPSPRRIEIYVDHLKKWAQFAGDPLVHKTRPVDVRADLAWLATEYKPVRFAKTGQPLSATSVHNVWISLSAFYRWASTELGIENPMLQVAAPKFVVKPVEPFTREEVAALLKACTVSREVRPTDRRAFVTRPYEADRNQAIILVLLDTGLRAGELCALNIGDYVEQTGKLEVKHGRSGRSKDRKGRLVYLGKAPRRTVWRYLAKREDRTDPDAPMFLGQHNRRMDRDVLRQVVNKIGRRAQVKHTHPHRFRHTFAITYLRAGGDVFTLQALLGHSTLTMVEHYAQVAVLDVEKAHRKASPADSWYL
jgi:integrase/recombinase XerD